MIKGKFDASFENKGESFQSSTEKLIYNLIHIKEKQIKPLEENLEMFTL